MADSTPPAKKPDVTWLTDSNGQKSSMRAMCVCALVAAIIFGGAIIFELAPYTEQKSSLVLYFLIAAFGGKAGQSFAGK